MKTEQISVHNGCPNRHHCSKEVDKCVYLPRRRINVDCVDLKKIRIIR